MIAPIDTAASDNAVTALKRPLHLLAVEPLMHTIQWGELLNHPSGEEIKAGFVGNVSAFEEFLTSKFFAFFRQI